VRDIMLCWIPCRAGYHVVRDTMSCGMQAGRVAPHVTAVPLATPAVPVLKKTSSEQGTESTADQALKWDICYIRSTLIGQWWASSKTVLRVPLYFGPLPLRPALFLCHRTRANTVQFTHETKPKQNPKPSLSRRPRIRARAAASLASINARLTGHVRRTRLCVLWRVQDGGGAGSSSWASFIRTRRIFLSYLIFPVTVGLTGIVAVRTRVLHRLHRH
jgi:hypothetical protein